MNDISSSVIDRAHDRFRAIRKDCLAYDSELNESDTRAKLIDPLFKSVLEWREQDIRREEPAADGYADYVFGAEFPYFHIEAKRTTPRFAVDDPSNARVLKLSGPHLLGNRDVKPFLEQAAKYSVDLGTV